MLPLKTRIFQYAMDKNKGITIEDIMKDLEPEYHGERIFNKKVVTDYVDSFLGVGFMKAETVAFDEKGQLKISCVVTDYGKTRKKYLPKQK